jgi:hypothetical protein
MRQLFGASGAALLAPGAVALALVALAVAGGFGQLSNLSQAFAGPAAPGPVAAPGVRAAAGAGAAVLPVVRAGAPPAPAGVAGGAARPGRGGRGVAAGPLAGIGPVGTSGPGSGSSGTGSAGTGTGTGTGTGSGAGGPPSGGSGSGQTLVDKVVGVGTSVTSQLPGALGPTATNVLQAVGNGLNSILPPGTSSAAAGTVEKILPGASLP